MQPILIAPSVLSADFVRLGEQVQAAEAGGAGWIHVDIMDGRFVPNITMGPLVVSALRRATRLPLDVHLMIVEPDALISAFAEAGADRITVHYEACRDLYRTINLIREHGCEAGVAINPHTRAAVLYDVLPIISEVIVMTVSPGFGGQSLISATLPKFGRLKAMLADHDHDAFFLVADGGVNPQTALEIVQAGANVLVAGSAIFGHAEGIAAGIAAIQQAVPTQEK